MRPVSAAAPRLFLAAVVALVCSCVGTRDAPPPRLQTIDGLDGLHGTVRVVVDGYGIPHIYATSRRDAAYALGWFHARDRFLQMDIFRRSGSGRLAELLGPAAIEEDRLARILGLHRAAESAWQHLVPARERRIIESYTAGVNAFLRQPNPVGLSVHYRKNGLIPEPWKPEDCFAIHKRFTAELSHSFDDVFLQLVAEKLGEDAALTLFPIERDDRVPTVREPRSPEFIMGLRRSASVERSAGTGDAVAREASPPLDGLATACADVLERFTGVPSRFASPGARASNCWVLSGRLTRDGHAILCSDPHLALSHPPTFYTAHLDSPGLSVIGITVPGSPAVIFGHNGTIAWAGTNAQADVTDFYVETFHPQDPTRFLHRGRWLPVEEIEEEIRVRGQESVKFTVRRTAHGPIITERGKTLSMRWMGGIPSAEIVSFLMINAARDVRSFLDALRNYVAPALTLVYADTEGHIAARPTGVVPRRARGLGRYPVDGAGGEHEWIAPVPFEEMPFSLDPAQGYIVSANQRLAPPDFAHYLGWEFDPAFRARRIDSVLRSSNRFTLPRMQQLQLDVLDLATRELLPVLVEAFVDEPPVDPIANLSLRLVRAWDHNVHIDAVEPTIAWKWLQTFADDVWTDEWERAQLPRSGNWGFCSNGWRPPLDVLVRLTLHEPDSPWFDDVRTEEREDRDALIRRSFLHAVESLVDEYGPTISTWAWGRRNRMILPDLLRTPDGGLDLGPVPGNINTVSPGGDGGVVTIGAVYRMALPLGDLKSARGAGPGIQASRRPGMRGREQAREQARSYLDGSYLPLYFHAFPGDFPDYQVEQLLIMTPNWPNTE